MSLKTVTAQNTGNINFSFHIGLQTNSKPHDVSDKYSVLPLKSCDHGRMWLCVSFVLNRVMFDCIIQLKKVHHQHACHSPSSVTSFTLRWVLCFNSEWMYEPTSTWRVDFTSDVLSEFTDLCVEMRHNETSSSMCCRSLCCSSSVWRSTVSLRSQSDVGVQHGSRVRHEWTDHVVVQTKALRSSSGVPHQTVWSNCGALQVVYWHIK